MDGRVHGEKQIKKLHKLAEENGLVVVVGKNDHFKIVGPLSVSWWPMSRKMTAYVEGTKGSSAQCDAAKVVAMALEPPPKRKKKIKRPNNNASRAWKRNKYKEQKGLCHWCKEPMKPPGGNGPEDATVDHVIPLKRNGLHNDNNKVLAHGRCNGERGDDMPEVTGQTIGSKTNEQETTDTYNHVRDFIFDDDVRD